MSGSRSLLAVLLALLAAAPVAAADTALKPEGIQWQRVEMTASKFLLSMEASFEQAAIDLAALEARLLTPMGPEEKQHIGYPLALSVVTEGLGRRNEVELLMDGADGAAVQRDALRLGGSPKFRTYRFEPDGLLRLTRRPDDGESDGPPERWSQLSEERHDYPVTEPDARVADASALVFLAAAAPLERPGDRLDVLTLASGEFHRVSLVVREPVKARADYLIVSGNEAARKSGRREAVRISVQGLPLDDADGESFEFLGLRDLELMLDPETRVPLEIRGKVEFFGNVSFRLDRVSMAPDR